MIKFTIFKILLPFLIIIPFSNYSQDTLVTSEAISLDENNSKTLKWVDLGAGFFRTDRQYSLYELNGGLNVVLKKGTYIGASYRTNFNIGNIRYGNKIYTSNHISLSVGHKENLTKSISIIPSVGVSYSQFEVTGTTYTSVFTPNSLENIAAGGELLSETRTYDTFNDTQIAVPMNLRVMFAAKSFGASLDFYLLASKYTSTGVRLLLHFGKTR